MSRENITIAIAGLHGVGKSSVAKYIANKYKLRYISSGELFREIAKEYGVSLEKLSKMAESDPSIDDMIDKRMKMEGSKGGIVGDALLSGWMLKDIADIKIWLKAPLDVRVKRISDREGRPYKDIYRETIIREESERRRFKKYYSIDIDDLSIYDYVISTHLLNLDMVIRIVDEIVKGYIEFKGRIR